eukprot:gene7377-12881_t
MATRSGGSGVRVGERDVFGGAVVQHIGVAIHLRYWRVVDVEATLSLPPAEQRSALITAAARSGQAAWNAAMYATSYSTKPIDE